MSSRVGFSSARTGRRARGFSGGKIKQFEYQMGTRKRLIFPIVKDGGLVLLARPYHPVKNQAIQLPRSNGQGFYNISKVRCTHPYAQVNFEESNKMAQTKQMCVFCDTAKYETRRMWSTIAEQYGDSFEAMTKEQKRKIFQELEKEKTVEASYYYEEQADGSKVASTLLDIYILALELVTDANGNVITELDAISGQQVAKYDPILMPVSKARLTKFKQSVEDALLSGQISRDILHPFIENKGTDDEEEVLVGFVDFLVSFPQAASKMESGRNMSVVPISQNLSVVNDGLIEKFNREADDLVKEAEGLFNRLFVNLKVHDREQAKDMFANGRDYFDELERLYRNHANVNAKGETIKTDDELDNEIFETVIENYRKVQDKIQNQNNSSENQKVAQATSQPVGTVPQETVAQPQQPIVDTPQPTPSSQPVGAGVGITPPKFDDSIFDY